MEPRRRSGASGRRFAEGETQQLKHRVLEPAGRMNGEWGEFWGMGKNEFILDEMVRGKAQRGRFTEVGTTLTRPLRRRRSGRP